MSDKLFDHLPGCEWEGTSEQVKDYQENDDNQMYSIEIFDWGFIAEQRVGGEIFTRQVEFQFCPMCGVRRNK